MRQLGLAGGNMLYVSMHHVAQRRGVQWNYVTLAANEAGSDERAFGFALGPTYQSSEIQAVTLSGRARMVSGRALLGPQLLYPLI